MTPKNVRPKISNDPEKKAYQARVGKKSHDLRSSIEESPQKMSKSKSADFFPRDAPNTTALTPIKGETYITMDSMLEDSAELQRPDDISDDSGSMQTQSEAMSDVEVVEDQYGLQEANEAKLLVRMNLVNIYKTKEGEAKRGPNYRQLFAMLKCDTDEECDDESSISRSVSRTSRCSHKSYGQF
jgi:hypothetical protein